jgi:hypothetical protein
MTLRKIVCFAQRRLGLAEQLEHLRRAIGQGQRLALIESALVFGVTARLVVAIVATRLKAAVRPSLAIGSTIERLDVGLIERLTRGAARDHECAQHQ